MPTVPISLTVLVATCLAIITAINLSVVNRRDEEVCPACAIVQRNGQDQQSREYHCDDDLSYCAPAAMLP